MKTLSLFDIDDTLFEVKAKIIIKNAITGEEITQITPGEYNSYEHCNEEELDFSQFICTNTFVDTSLPIKNVIDVLKKLHSIAKISDSEVYLLTARQDFDDKEKFLEFLIKHGIEAGHKNEQKVHVLRAGNIPGLDNASKKYQIIKELLKNNCFDSVSLYDDSISNLKAFQNIELVYPNINVEPYLIKEGKIKKIKKEG